MERNKHRIDSLNELQRRVPSIVKAINADQNLAMRAAANPILAIEELGFTLSEDLRLTLERRIRFSVETIERLNTLAEKVFKIVGHHFNLDSSSELTLVLFDELGLHQPKCGVGEQSAVKLPSMVEESPVAPLPYRLKQAPRVTDPLEELRGHHPIIEPLLEYRRLEASSPRLAPLELYQRIQRGEVSLPVRRVQARLQRGPTPE